MKYSEQLIKELDDLKIAVSKFDTFEGMNGALLFEICKDVKMMKFLLAEKVKP